MEKLHLVSAGLLAFLLISCDQGLPDENAYSPSPAATSTSTAEAANSVPAPAIAAPVRSPVSASAPAPVINPAHGQPGHRCDIAVGELITSAAANNAPNAAKNFSTVALPPVQAPKIAGFANAANATNRNIPATPSLFPMRSSVQLPSGATPQINQTNALNPAHGKPGHRCEIAVGAPLNSAARTATAVPSAAATAPASTIAVPTAPAISVPAQPVAVVPGMNPSHGQPGHRCDIPVGSPLNSKP